MARRKKKASLHTGFRSNKISELLGNAQRRSFTSAEISALALGQDLTAANKFRRVSLRSGLSSGEVSEYYASLLESYYVRPAGATYGTGDGSSYDNAWAGDAGIDWMAMGSGATLYGAGTWAETLTVDNSNVTIRSYDADPWVFDSALLNSGVVVVSKSNVTLIGVTVLNVLVNGFYFENCTNIVTTDCTGSQTGNQGFQHIGTTTFTHNNPTAVGNTDDGISLHDSCVGVINGGTFTDNDHQINIVADALLTINDSPAFSGTSSYDLYVTNATTPNSSVITMNGGTVRNINADLGGRIVLNDVTVSGTTSISIGAGAGSFEGNRSILSSTFNIAADGVAVLNSCFVEVVGTYLGSITFSKSYVKDDLNLGSTATIIAEYTIFDGTGTAASLVDVNSGALGQIKYCLFKNMAATQFGVSFRTGASASSYVNNCVFAGTANSGRGTFSQMNITLNNNIYFDLAIGHFRSAGDHILNNCCFNDCTTPKSGTNITSNNEVTGAPLFTNVATNDYSLAEGSSCIGTGANLGSTFLAGIDIAVWGDGDPVPVVTTADQTVSWNIGAYV